MGSRSGKSAQETAESNYARNRTEFSQAQRAFESRSRFGKSSTRVGGLSSDQIGKAPTMRFSEGIVGVLERSIDSRRRGGSSRGAFGFGGSSTLG